MAFLAPGIWVCNRKAFYLLALCWLECRGPWDHLRRWVDAGVRVWLGSISGFALREGVQAASSVVGRGIVCSEETVEERAPEMSNFIELGF